MKITARQLRQIIKEELIRSRRLNEADLFTQADLDAEFDADIERRTRRPADPFADIDLSDPRDDAARAAELGDTAMKMPTSSAGPNQISQALDSIARSAGVSKDTIMDIQSRVESLEGNLDADAPGAFDIGGIVFRAYADNRAMAKLSAVAEGKRIMKRGDRGNDVVVAQALLLGTLRDASEFIIGKRGIYSDSAAYMQATAAAESLGARAIVQKALAGKYVTFVELTELLIDVLGKTGITIDGVFGEGTFNAVVAAQLCSKYMTDAAGATIVIDGTIGRETKSFLMGYKELGTATGDDYLTRYKGMGVDPVTAREVPEKGGLARGRLEFRDLQEQRRRRR